MSKHSKSVRRPQASKRDRWARHEGSIMSPRLGSLYGMGAAPNSALAFTNTATMRG